MDSEDDLASELDAARRAHERAYSEVRRLIDARLLRPPIIESSLTERQREALATWEAAEVENDRARRRWHAERPDAHKPDPDDEQRPSARP